MRTIDELIAAVNKQFEAAPDAKDAPFPMTFEEVAGLLRALHQIEQEQASLRRLVLALERYKRGTVASVEMESTGPGKMACTVTCAKPLTQKTLGRIVTANFAAYYSATDEVFGKKVKP